MNTGKSTESTPPFPTEGETVAEAVRRLNTAGYTEDLRAEARGLNAMTAGCVHPANQFLVDEVVRFEGVTDPDDEAIVFALTCLPHGVRGTFVTAYGPKMPRIESEIVEALSAPRS